MALTYEEFKNIVPKETVTFFDELTQYLNYYIGKNKYVFFKDSEHASEHKDSRVFFLSLYALSSLKEYMAFLGELGYKRNAYKIDEASMNINNNSEELYEKYNYILPQFEDKTLYYGLQPLDIVSDAYKKYYNNCQHQVFDVVFGATSCSNLTKKISGVIEEKRQIQEREIEKEIYENVPIEVISYIETAAKIRALLPNKLSYVKSEIAKELDVDVVPLSLLLALFFNNNNNNTKNILNSQGALVCLLEEKGITLEKILKVLNISITSREIKETPKNIYAIKSQYGKYYQYGNGINFDSAKISVQGVMKNVLNRNFTNSLVIEKILSNLDCSLDMFKNIETDTINAVENKKRIAEQESVKAFYKDVPKKTRDFIEFVVKTYTLILEKMKEKKHNDGILSTENDAIVLALYISSYYYNGKISEFFNDKGVTFGKVLKLLNLEIKKEDIEKRQVDRKVLVEKYKRFVYEGENKNKSTNRITIDDICYNMCRRDFNKTIILENIFNSLSQDTELTENFSSQLKEHFILKEKKRADEKTQKLFCDMPVETIKMLEMASGMHYKLLNKKDLDKRGVQSIAILLSALNSPLPEIKEFLQSLGFNSSKICSYFNVDGRLLTSNPADINLLTNEYGLLIFGLANKDKPRQELTPMSIIKNIFSKKFNNSVAISKFLSEFKLSYDDFEKFDLLYKSYNDKKEKEKRDNEISQSLNGYSKEICNHLRNSTRVYKLLLIEKENGNLNEELVKNEEDLEILSFVFALFCDSTKTREFFRKRGIDVQKLTSVLGINPEFMHNYSSVEVDYDILKEHFFKYIKADKNKSSINLSSIFKKLIDNKPFGKTIIELCGCNYEFLERELRTGRDYEDTLTVDDRIRMLSTDKVDALDTRDMESILSFGNALLPHSKYINDVLPALVRNDTNETAISTINEMISQIYIEEKPEEKQQSLLSRWFNGEESEEPPRLIVNRSKIYELENSIDNNIAKLKQELLKYNAIRKYIEEYAKKNRAYYAIADDAVAQINSKLSELDPNDDEDYADFLTASSFLQIVNDKANRFATVNLLMRKELLKVNQAIVNHFVTINSLEMARNDLIPLIETELTISEGRNTENDALDISHNIMGLFQSLLTRDVNSAVQNMDKLQKASVPEELMISITNDINTYIQGVSQIKALEEKMDSIENPQESKEKPLIKK